jgi:hypothetical protein
MLLALDAVRKGSPGRLKQYVSSSQGSVRSEKRCAKGVRYLLPKWPVGCFAQKVPDPYRVRRGRPTEKRRAEVFNWIIQASLEQEGPPRGRSQAVLVDFGRLAESLCDQRRPQ